MSTTLSAFDNKKTMQREYPIGEKLEQLPEDSESPFAEKVELRVLCVGSARLRLVQIGNEKRIEMKAGAEFIPLDSWSRRDLANAYPYARAFIEEHTSI